MKSNNTFKHSIENEKKYSEQSLYLTWHVKQIKTRVAIYSLHNWHDTNTVFPVIRNCWLLFSIHNGYTCGYVCSCYPLLQTVYSFNENCSLNKITKGKNLFYFPNSLHGDLFYFYLYMVTQCLVVWRICFCSSYATIFV